MFGRVSDQFIGRKYFSWKAFSQSAIVSASVIIVLLALRFSQSLRDQGWRELLSLRMIDRNEKIRA
jgi:hypothetical protein